MKFSFVSVYLTILLAIGFAVALPVINGADESALLLREVDEIVDDLISRHPESYLEGTELDERNIFSVVAKVGSKIIGGIKHLIQKGKAKRAAKKAAKAAAAHAAGNHHKRDLEFDDELAERELEAEIEDLFQRYFDIELEDEMAVRDVYDVPLEDLE
ncbi:hypothetical protein FA13DRAFT_1416043 [Coprinellus micaceus]|uniref:Uncharacterized protein n=1 Tax=Coprinellus micaceus TaxID=71717 RepID=A0A4Y7SNX6_COPMI|nr:hypothetical protein FA13DRAFT_1416043 [Coprinellus micaceus]